MTSKVTGVEDPRERWMNSLCRSWETAFLKHFEEEFFRDMQVSQVMPEREWTLLGLNGRQWTEILDGDDIPGDVAGLQMKYVDWLMTHAEIEPAGIEEDPRIIDSIRASDWCADLCKYQM